MLNLNRGWKHTSYYMMIGACAWFCCVAKIARQIMIFDLDLETTSNLNQKFVGRLVLPNSENRRQLDWDQAQNTRREFLHFSVSEIFFLFEVL